jgi:glycosyltransferase involved in cell wall biosynthesis
MREALGLRFALVYTEGCAMPPGDYPPADHYHQISKVTLEDAARHGHDPARMSLIPCGIDLDRFATSNSREDVRHRFGIRPETFVVLSVAALNRNHKRTHHLIEEVSRLDGDVLLWLDGSLDHGEPELVDVATQRLGDRCLVTHVPSDQVGDLFRAADVMAHAALFEAFGLSIVEAAASGVPLLIHDAPHFQWLVPNSECHIDMSEEGMLAERLGGLMANRSSLEGLTDTANARSTYAWPVLAGNYLNLYRSVAEARAQS